MKYLIPFLAGALMMWLLLQTCNKTTVVDTQAIDSVNNIVAQLSLQHTADSLAVIAAHNENDSLRNIFAARLLTIEQKAAAKITQLTFERNKFRTALEGRDTASAVESCERFMNLYDSAIGLVVIYKSAVDSLQANGADRRFLDSTAILGLNQIVSDLQKQIASYQKLLVDAVKDNADLRTALSRSKKGRLILAGIAAIVGGVAVGLIK